MKPLWISALLSFLLAACSEEKQPYQPPTPKTPASPLFQNQQQALDRAKGVEQTMQDRTRTLEQKSEEK